MGEIFFHKRNIAEEITGSGEQTYPGQASDYIIVEERAVMHGADTGHKGGEGTDDGHEAAEENSFGAVLLIKLLCLFHMVRFNQAVVAFQQFLAELFPNPVVTGIT